MRVSVILPAKNEASGLAGVLEGLMTLEHVCEVIVVDDGSEDLTGEIAQQYGAKVVRHHRSRGNGAAIKTGARNAVGDWILFMDADGQHQPSEIPLLINRQFETGAEMVVGARDRAGQSGVPRLLANSIYNKLASVVTGSTILDLTSGFRLVEKAKFMEFIHLLPNKFSYPTTSTMAFFRAGYAVEYVNVNVKKRIGESHVKPIKDGLKFLLIIFKIATLYSPLKVFVPFSVFFFVLGLARYVYTYVSEGTFTNMSALLMVTAVQVFLIGLVSEQVSAIGYKKPN